MTLAILENEPLAPRTTIGLGGPARFLIECADQQTIVEALQFARQSSLPVWILGGGSNIVFSDEGFAGVVLVPRVLGQRVLEENAGSILLEVGAGEIWDSFVERTVEQGLVGVECLSGIPGLVGGTPIQNVGAYGQECHEVIESVQVLDRQSMRLEDLTASACGFGYRHSRFKSDDRNRFVVTLVRFRLRRERTGTVRYAQLSDFLQESGIAPNQATSGEVRQAVLAIRKTKAMVYETEVADSHSCGSFFVNPVVTAEEFRRLQLRHSNISAHPAGADRYKLSAAWLVEHAGFPKGTRRGSVGVSGRHSLALVNHGGTSSELRALAAEIRRSVLERFGVPLRPEPLIIDERGEILPL